MCRGRTWKLLFAKTFRYMALAPSCNRARSNLRLEHVAGPTHITHPLQRGGVALANKLARMAWAVLTKNEPYRPPVLADSVADSDWPADDGCLATALEIATRFPHPQTSGYYGVDEFCQVCWRTTRWHNGRTRRSQNPKPEQSLKTA